MDECSTVEITKIREEVDYLMTVFVASQNPNNSDRTIMVKSDALESLSSELAGAVDKENTTILPNDLRNTIDTVEVLLRFNKVSTCACIY